MRIYIAIVDCRPGRNVFAARTKEGLIAALAGFCRDFWSELLTGDDKDPERMSDEDVVDFYFRHHLDENVEHHEFEIDD